MTIERDGNRMQVALTPYQDKETGGYLLGVTQGAGSYEVKDISFLCHQFAVHPFMTVKAGEVDEGFRKSPPIWGR